MKAANNAPTYLALYPQLAEIARKHGRMAHSICIAILHQQTGA